MTEQEFIAELQCRDLALDEGNLIQGPFIPDGMYRVYDLETHDVLATGRTLQDVIEDLGWRSR